MLLWVFLETRLQRGSDLSPTTEERSIKSSGYFSPSCSNVSTNLAYAHNCTWCWDEVYYWKMKQGNHLATCRRWWRPHLLMTCFWRTSVVHIWILPKLRAVVLSCTSTLASATRWAGTVQTHSFHLQLAATTRPAWLKREGSYSFRWCTLMP